jgi:alanine racemase
VTGTEIPREAYLSWLEVDLECIRSNYRLMRKRMAGRELFAVVKADAYGHGAVEVARALSTEKPAKFCVARVEEAVELRGAGIEQPILVLAPPLEAQAAVAARYDFEIVVCHPQHIHAMAKAARQHQRAAKVHLKVDIGMGRLGVRPEQVPEMLELLAAYSELELEGVMSHFPCADSPPDCLTDEQAVIFAEVVRVVQKIVPNVRHFHTANSAAILQHPSAHFTAGRAGITLYGQRPSEEMSGLGDLRPAIAMRTRVSFLKDVGAGMGLSYGLTYHTTRPSRIASVPLGYADGYPRHASNKAQMLVRGKRVAQVGRVCMDHVLLDVTDVTGVEIGDIVTAIGHDGGEEIRPEELAGWCGTIGYEITTRVGKRLPKFYSGQAAPASKITGA